MVEDEYDSMQPNRHLLLEEETMSECVTIGYTHGKGGTVTSRQVTLNLCDLGSIALGEAKLAAEVYPALAEIIDNAVAWLEKQEVTA